MQFGGQGGLLDTFLQVAVPGFGLMRNLKAMEDPALYGKGTMYGMATNYGKDGFSLGNIGNNLGFPGSDGGWFGGSNNYPSSPYSSGYNLSDGGWFGSGIGANVGSDTGLGGAYGELGYDLSEGNIASDGLGGYAATDEGDMAAEEDAGIG